MVNQGLNLLLNELRLIAEHINISDYENKSTKHLIKALRRSSPRLGIEQSKVKEIKDFYNLRYKFSKKDADKYRKLFYDIKNYRHLSELEIGEIIKKFNKLEKNLNFKKPRNNINTIHYEALDSDKGLNLEDVDDDEYREIGSVRRLFVESNKDYYKPKVINRGFAGEVNNYTRYISEGDKDEKLSPGEYLKMIRPDLKDLINRRKPIERLNNNNDNNNNNNNNNSADTNNNNNNTDCGEWKIMSRMYIKYISTKRFDERRTMHPKCKQVEFYMGSDTKNVINTVFNTLLQNFQRIQMKEDANLFLIVLNY